MIYGWGMKIIGAVIVLIIGLWIIGKIRKGVKKSDEEARLR